MKRLINNIIFILCTCLCWSCADEEIVQGIDYSKPAEVKFSVNFSEMEMVSSNSRAAGNVIDEIYNVCILFYQNGELVTSDGFPVYIYTGKVGTYSQLTKDGNVITVKKTLRPGSYQVVAVANMGNLVQDRLSDVETLAKLREISLVWNSQDIAVNNQMFGVFSETSVNSIDKAVETNGGGSVGLRSVNPTNDEYLTSVLLRGGEQTIYAKLYRAATKVTVGFDAENMNARVVVTVKSIEICNLPGSTKLWEPTKLEGESGKTSNQIRDNMNLEVRNKGIGESLFPADAHARNSESFFLFENRQGIDDKNSYNNGHKDKLLERVPNGTYIEIKARYDDQTEVSGSHGDITYRYMIGEDVANIFNNYNLTRNRHYKVTLVFKNSAKEEPYWRVEYTEDPVINIPSEVRLTYRHAGTFPSPIQFTVDEEDDEIELVTAEITKNPWYDTPLEGSRREAENVVSANDKLKWGFLCWGDQERSYPNSPVYSPWKTESRILTGQLATQIGSIKRYKYELNLQTEALAFCSENTENAAQTFTGYNNYSNPRIAEVTVIVKYKNSEKPSKIAVVKVVQEPRVVNPIAIYRKAGNDEPFHIRLLNAQGKEIDSYGPWTAEVEEGADWVRISRIGDNYGNAPVESGAAGGAIRFYYKPIDGKSIEPRCGVIRIAYSNNSVIHRIYVRQGYDPITIGEGDALWTSFNYLGKDDKGIDQFASSPMEEGAWLKNGNSEGILATDYYKDGNYYSGGFQTNLASYPTSSHNSKSWSTLPSGGSFAVSEHRLPNQKEMSSLLSQDNKNMSGFGVGYDDNANETLAFDEDAQYTNKAMGRRGVVMCDADGKNIFFPIGKRGYGRIRNQVMGMSSNELLHYSNENNRYLFSSDKGTYRPNLIDLYKAYGAYYWIEEASGSNQQMTFNYSLANIETQSKNEVSQDACFARLIKKIGPDKITVSKYVSFICGNEWPTKDVILTLNTSDAEVVMMRNLSGQASWEVQIAYLETVDMANIVLTFSYLNYEKKMTLKEFEKVVGSIIMDKK